MATTTSAKRQAAAAAKRAKAEVEAGAEDVAAEARQAGARAKRQASALEDTLTRSAEDIAATVSERLRAVGVDTDKMVDVAKEQATELQQQTANLFRHCMSDHDEYRRVADLAQRFAVDPAAHGLDPRIAQRFVSRFFANGS